jgi:selenocysteine-specific elongation factor
MNIIIGTAGHIDHGKTALIKALTGADTDRLPEEKKRGITIDLGFAELALGEHRIGFVDVPGHERFVKNMLAGASGIDLVLLVIAADEGVMPQTREHFDICRLLGVKSGLIVLTKCDLVDDELLDLVRLEAAELVEGSFLGQRAVIAVSSKTGKGIDDLKGALIESAGSIHARSDHLVTRLPIDRSFVVKGFGTVVTGTLASGSIKETDQLSLMPTGRKVRVRGLQTHGEVVKVALAGQRVAVNLASVDQNQIERGMTLCEAGALQPVQNFDAQIEVLKSGSKPVRSRQRVRVHLGTAEVLARVHVINEPGEIRQGETDLAQFRLEMPVVAVPGERFIVRSYSPQVSIAGGVVFDNSPKKHRKREREGSRNFLHALIKAGEDRAEVTSLIVEASVENGLRFDDLQARTGWTKSVIEKAINLERIVDTGGVYIGSEYFEGLNEKTLKEIIDHHNREPLSEGLGRETLREKIFAHKPPEVFKAVIGGLEQAGLIVAENDRIRSGSHAQTLTEQEQKVLAALKDIFLHADLEVPKLDAALDMAIGATRLPIDGARKLVKILINSGEIIKVTDDFYFASGAITGLTEKLRAYATSGADRSIDVSKFKDLAGVSRKYAIPLLEYFDRTKVTVRSGDRRLVL